MFCTANYLVMLSASESFRSDIKARRRWALAPGENALHRSICEVIYDI